MPAAENTGIIFIRADIKGRPKIKASLENVKSTSRGTNLSNGGAAVCTVEHILSALYALSITNLEIELDSEELPALDGSSKPYCDLLISSGVARQKQNTKTIEIKEPVIAMDGGKCIIGLPSNRFAAGFMINYPVNFIGTQFFGIDISPEGYLKDIAQARTYGFIDELETLKNKGLAAGATKDNAVAIGKEGYLSELRYGDELVRHKVLDMIGDISLAGAQIKGRIIGIRAGHELNIKFAKMLKEVG